ncbi:MAG: hypothetical protein ACRDZR_17765 [Acidimicrobiales bacterium]
MCNLNRGTPTFPLRGVPYAVVFVLVVLVAYTIAVVLLVAVTVGSVVRRRSQA